MRPEPYTTARLYRWVKPKENPMSDVIGDPPEEEEDDEEEGDEEEDDDGIESWETENGLVFEIHEVDEGTRDCHDEVLVIEEQEKGEPKDVAIALSIEDVDEAILTLKEIREEMVKRQAARTSPAVVKTPPPKTAARGKK